MKLILVLAYFLTFNAFGHGSGLDRDGKGGHLNQSIDEYHCHREPCLSSESRSEVTNQIEETIPEHRDGACSDLLQFGRPEAGNILLCRAGYAVGFDCDKRSALWVTYNVTPGIHNSANVPRYDNFRADPELPRNCRKELKDFSGIYDRGHLVSSATLDANTKMNAETFLLSNMSPQLPKFNRAIWKGLENRERKWSNLRGSLYVIAGPVFISDWQGDGNDWQGDGIPIPSHFYKIIVDPARSEAISFLIPHRPLHTSQLDRFRTSIDEIEFVSGIDFLMGLDDDLEALLEKSVSKMWRR
jgi:endonuclease G, mitochondrial